MKVIRFFLSNLILVAFFCGVIYVYYYWDNLTGEDTPVGQAVAYLSKEFKEVDTFVKAIRQKQDGQETNGEDIAVIKDVPAQTGTDLKAEAQAAIKQDVPSGGDVFITPEIEQSLNRTYHQQNFNRPKITQPISPSVAAKPDISAGPKSAGTSSADLNSAGSNSAGSDRELWIKARKAFYTRKFEESISSYQLLIAGRDDNFDAYGELGNVYFNQGKKTEAAAAYYEAAAILVRLGQTRRAGSLMPLLNHLDAEKASQLKELIGTGQS